MACECFYIGFGNNVMVSDIVNSVGREFLCTITGRVSNIACLVISYKIIRDLYDIYKNKEKYNKDCVCYDILSKCKKYIILFACYRAMRYLFITALAVFYIMLRYYSLKN